MLLVCLWRGRPKERIIKSKSISLSNYLSINLCQSVSLPVYLSIHSSAYLSKYPCNHRHIYRPISPSINLCTYLFFYLSIYHVTIDMSIDLSIYLSIYRCTESQACLSTYLLRQKFFLLYSSTNRFIYLSLIYSHLNFPKKGNGQHTSASKPPPLAIMSTGYIFCQENATHITKRRIEN